MTAESLEKKDLLCASSRGHPESAPALLTKLSHELLQPPARMQVSPPVKWECHYPTSEPVQEEREHGRSSWHWTGIETITPSPGGPKYRTTAATNSGMPTPPGTGHIRGLLPNAPAGERTTTKHRSSPEPQRLEEADPGWEPGLPKPGAHAPSTISTSLSDQVPGEDRQGITIFLFLGCSLSAISDALKVQGGGSTPHIEMITRHFSVSLFTLET